MTIKILLADDRYLIQETIKAVLRDETEIEIIGIAKNGIEAIFLAKKLQPDIVLLDIEMPKMNGIEATKHICQLLPDTKVIMLSSHNERQYIAKALKAGAASYLLKDSFVGDLKQAIYSLTRGYSYIETRLLNQAIDKIKANNIVNSQNGKTNIKRYRKGIYVPAKTPSSDEYFYTATQIKSSRRVNKSSPAPIFSSSSPDEIESADSFAASLQKISIFQTNNQNPHRRQLIFALIAIASFILSVIIFS